MVRQGNGERGNKGKRRKPCIYKTVIIKIIKKDFKGHMDAQRPPRKSIMSHLLSSALFPFLSKDRVSLSPPGKSCSLPILEYS